MKHALALVVVAALGCRKHEEPVQVVAPVSTDEAKRPAGGSTDGPDTLPAGEAGDRKALLALPVVDGVGFLTGNYHTSSNNPAMYADPERKLFVLLGKKARLELPLGKPEDAIAAYEQFLLQHGYAANGKTAPDDHQKVMVDGKEMVVMQMSELLPEMPADLASHFTPRQRKVIGNTTGTNGFKLFSGHDKDYAPHPMLYAGAKAVFVVGPDTDKQFPIEQASAAFAEYRAMLKRTKLAP
jgi:hypothetical protein